MPKDLSGAQVGMSPRAGVNDPRPNNSRGRNVFPQTYKHLTTDRYGEYSPFFWCKAERGDVQNLKTDHDLHTFTLKSPMVSDVTMTKSFIKVPMQAIYPINWEKMMTIPTQGDDVPADTRALLDISTLLNNLLSNLKDGNIKSSIFFPKALVLLESIVSNGSLFAKFNYHFNYRFNYDGDSDISGDELMDYLWTKLLGLVRDADLSLIMDDDKSVSLSDVSEHRFLEILRSNDYSLSDNWEDLNFVDSLKLGSIEFVSGFRTFGEPNLFINIEPIIAYQLACAQFGTNDFVDYIYSADLYRQNMLSLFYDTYGDLPTFNYNGVLTMYDVFSGFIFSFMIASLHSVNYLDYFINLFTFVPSLRYGDYFTGAKPRPLAVGEYSAQVVDNSVSAIDVTKSIQMQRLLNQVNMVGRKLGDYLAGIFGGQLPEAPNDVPIFLAHQSFSINGFDTENTGEIQFDPDTSNTITSHLRSSENRHSFDIEISEPCYIIGMNSYSSPRIYSKSLDRFAFHHDRYDDFIPQMQYIGDQEIYLSELDSSVGSLVPWAYTLRFMEYKQRYSYASGGFIEYLPSWAFITDNTDGNPLSAFISPSYIRSSPSEFDRFYKSLTGYSLGSYFHFIVAHTNITEPVRQMEYAPEILK